MLRVLEHILDQPMIQADATLGQKGSKGEMNVGSTATRNFLTSRTAASGQFPGDPTHSLMHSFL